MSEELQERAYEKIEKAITAVLDALKEEDGISLDKNLLFFVIDGLWSGYANNTGFVEELLSDCQSLTQSMLIEARRVQIIKGKSKRSKND